ncbi:MAG: hypothetical protein F4086_18150 [Gemmatimonadetes bacterium]|nr:hypothetical protein [Dehalococcoidia bacterium]MYJ12231.1 hypothetical protein [Gemmatimonadota bacterium]
MNTADVIGSASVDLEGLTGHVFDVLTLARPGSAAQGAYLSSIISKLSPLVGNLIEFSTVEFLNARPAYASFGEWKRQDPGFPDTVFEGTITPAPGFEIKAWFPLATEITARFRDSQAHFAEDQTYVCMLAWLPEHIVFGKPRIVDVCVVSGKSVAQARDNHYHNPPDYLVIEPEDTSARTSNLQQTNTNGYKFQGTPEEFSEAEAMVASWGSGANAYQTTPEYQGLLRQLQGRFTYRLDTNFAKMDRIVHPGIEVFKERVLGLDIYGRAIKEWSRLLRARDESARLRAVEEVLVRSSSEG